MKFIALSSLLSALPMAADAMGKGQFLNLNAYLLGVARVERAENKQDNHQVIFVRKCLSDGVKVKSIILASNTRTVQIDSIDIKDMNGKVANVKVNKTLQAGMKTEEANLPSHIRCVESVTINGDAVDARYAEITVGLRAEN